MKMHPNDGPRHERAAGRRSVDARMRLEHAMLDRFDLFVAASSAAALRCIFMPPKKTISIPLGLTEEWLPLLGTDVVGLYVFYLGKFQNGTLKSMRLSDIATYCRLGKARVVEINKILQSCGLLLVEPPKGFNRMIHAITKLTPLPVPEQIPDIAKALYQHVKGFIYLLGNTEQRWYKIGRTKDLGKRMKALKLPFEMTLIHSFKSNNTIGVERLLHERFQEKRIEGEWFKLNEDDVSWLCSIESLDEEVKQ